MYTFTFCLFADQFKLSLNASTVILSHSQIQTYTYILPAQLQTFQFSHVHRLCWMGATRFQLFTLKYDYATCFTCYFPVIISVCSAKLYFLIETQTC